MEELGIGRPSTYASIIQVLQDRNYVRLEARRFVPEDRGRVVIAFLSSFFERYIEYDFTADLEQKLDDVSNGDRERAVGGNGVSVRVSFVGALILTQKNKRKKNNTR